MAEDLLLVSMPGLATFHYGDLIAKTDLSFVTNRVEQGAAKSVIAGGRPRIGLPESR